jgi:hypothetical protein
MSDDRWDRPSYAHEAKDFIELEWGHPKEHYKIFGMEVPKTIIIQGLMKTAEEFLPSYTPRSGWSWERSRRYS